jgi:hypothetical protein
MALRGRCSGPFFIGASSIGFVGICAAQHTFARCGRAAGRRRGHETDVAMSMLHALEHALHALEEHRKVVLDRLKLG